MADIDIVKKSSRTWLWVVLAIVGALVLWFVIAGTRGPETTGSLFDTPQPYARAVSCDGGALQT
jgi:hypothetical protein